MENIDTWKRSLRRMIADLCGYEGDSDHPNCPRCNAVMDFYGHDEDGDFDYGDGHWDCPECGFSFYEDEL